VIANLLRFAAVLPTLSVAADEPSFGMIGAVCFSAAEIFFCVGAFFSLYETIETVSDGRIKTKKAGIFTLLLFLSVKTFAALPELIYLYSFDPAVSGMALFPLEPYKNALRFDFFLFSVVFSSVSGTVVLRFFGNLKKDRDFRQTVSSLLASHPEDQAFTVKKTSIAFFTVILVAVWTAFPIEVDGSRMIPILLPVICLLIASLLLRKTVNYTGGEIAVISVAAVLSVIFSIASFAFASEYDRSASVNFGKYIYQFIFPALALLFLTVFTVISINVTRKKINEIVSFHTGVMWSSEYQKHNKETLNLRKGLISAVNISSALWSVFSVVSLAAFALKYVFPTFSRIIPLIFLIPAVISTVTAVKIEDGIKDRYNEKDNQ
ncbi:MAG: hypothetical protein KBT31_00715, partial [Firmicutes bacterium]|nr:hypothetical protein [Candidatus Colimorpha enterica]